MTPAPNLSFRLDAQSGVPAYRQIMDQVHGGLAIGALKPGDQLPTVRQLAVDLSINLNTVVRAYRELEIRGVLSTQQGLGTFIKAVPPTPDPSGRERLLTQLVGEFMARAGAAGFSAEDIQSRLQEYLADPRSRP
jgi:GntR family transcriptional regulator